MGTPGSKFIQKRKRKIEITYRTWIPGREERGWKQPSRSLIFWVSLGEFAMASRGCRAPFEGFCFLQRGR